MPQPSELAACLKELHLSSPPSAIRRPPRRPDGKTSATRSSCWRSCAASWNTARRTGPSDGCTNRDFRLEKALASFDPGRLPAKVAATVNTLLEGEFISRAENVLAFGNPEAARPTCCAPSPRS